MKPGSEPDFDLLNMIIVAHSAYFLDRDKDLQDMWPIWLIRHHGWLKRYMKARKFPTEANPLLDLIDNDVLYAEAKGKEASYLIVVLELTKIWIESGVPTPAFNVTKRTLKGGRAHVGMQMLMLKRQDRAAYNDKKQIIEDSIYTARCLWGAFNRYILGGAYPYKAK